MPPDQPRGVDASASAPLIFATIIGKGGEEMSTWAEKVTELNALIRVANECTDREKRDAMRSKVRALVDEVEAAFYKEIKESR